MGTFFFDALRGWWFTRTALLSAAQLHLALVSGRFKAGKMRTCGGTAVMIVGVIAYATGLFAVLYVAFDKNFGFRPTRCLSQMLWRASLIRTQQHARARAPWLAVCT